MTSALAQRSSTWLGALALLVLAMFGDLLVSGARVVGDPSGDMLFHTLPWRSFGFGELAKGNLALWNPYVYGGAPYFGGSQAALLYPTNWLFLALPTPLALNWSVAVDCWLAGAFMFLWARRRGLSPFAAFVCGALYIFCAPHFHRLGAGLVTNLAAIAWAPLIFLCIDEWLACRRWQWCLLGMLAVTAQILAGQPQYVYYTALIAALYAALRLLEPMQDRARAAAGLVCLYAGGALLGAVQLLPALQATAETVRSEALPYAFASAYSFPPENLVTLLAPGFFGDAYHQPYWGRYFLQETCAFIGVTGLVLAIHGFGARLPGKRALLIVAALSVVLALGGNTPLHRVLYDWLPMFDRFRANARFIYLAAMLLILLAGYGLDRILRERAVPARLVLAAGATAAVLAVGAAVVRGMDWVPVFIAMVSTQESFADPAIYGNAAGIMAAQAFAALSLAVAAGVLAVAAGIALCVARAPGAALLLGALAVAEVFVFARLQRPSFDRTASPAPPELQKMLPRPADYRIVNLLYQNGGMVLRVPDAWGYDPFVERRYAELVHWSVGNDPARATQELAFTKFHPLLAMLRVKYTVDLKDRVLTLTPGAMPPLGQVELVGAYELRSGRQAVLGALGDPSFDPRRTVILEREPQPTPVRSASQGRAAVVRQSTDWLEIEADVASPSVLLVTDAWSPAWRARPLEGSAASRYEVMPANYALRAIPLAAGKHRLRLEYSPAVFRLGVLISSLAAVAWLAAFFTQRKIRA